MLRTDVTRRPMWFHLARNRAGQGRSGAAGVSMVPPC